MPLAPADPGAFPPSERTNVIALASSKTADHQNPDSAWTLDQLAFSILQEANAQDFLLAQLASAERVAQQAMLDERMALRDEEMATLAALLPEELVRPMSRSTIQRILTAADLKPHRSVYWLNSHDPDFATKAKSICQLYLDAPRLYQEGRLVFSCDEKTGMQILQRKYPTQLAQPGKPEKIEFEYIRYGTRCLLTTFCVPTGQVVWDLGQTRTSADWVAHLRHVFQQFPDQKGYDWVVDNLNTHWSLQLCLEVAQWCGITVSAKQLETGKQRRAFLSDPSHKHVFHFTPIHGSWLNQVELFFSVFSRRLLKRGDFASAEEFETRVKEWLEVYNERHAHPYRWTYTGEPLVRATPFSQTDRQRRQGRAWFGTRPQLFDRILHPPRPYRRQNKAAAANTSTATTPVGPTGSAISTPLPVG